MNEERKKKPRAIALLSGGLDSSLAVKLMLDLGVDVEALNLATIFCNCTSARKKRRCGNEARRVSRQFGIKLTVLDTTPEYIEMIKNPAHGRGSGMNPCIDCRIYLLHRAKEYMHENGIDFVVTGEVLGQRPMSQHMRAMRLIERESGLEGLIVRPLSAKLLPPTIPEKEALIDREKLLDMKGRSRKPQMQLALEKGVTDYPAPAGGCLLTDKSFSMRLRDLLEHEPDAGLAEIRLLKYGRHFRLPGRSKIIVGRDKSENEMLERFGNGYGTFQAADGLGPLTLAPQNLPEKTKKLIASITARYSQGRDKASLLIRHRESGKEELLEVGPAKDSEFAEWRVG